jgi:hypothetical protein
MRVWRRGLALLSLPLACSLPETDVGVAPLLKIPLTPELIVSSYIK